MKETWNPAEIPEDIKPVNYVNADSWNAAELNEAINLFGIKYPVDTWNPAELDEKARNIINDITSTKIITGNPILFKTINGGYAKSCEITFSPIQSGSGDPSPENVRPISGRDSVVLNQCGKNLFDISTISENANLNGTDGIAGTNAYSNTSDYIRVAYGYPYTFSCSMGTPQSATARYICFYKSDKTFISSTYYSTASGNITKALTIPQNAEYVRISYDKSGTNIQLELGSSATTYESYQGSTHTATFSDTVYGGEYDFVSGKAKSEWGYIASYNGETITEPWISDRDVYVAGTTPSTGAEVCYKLATPTEITLTPETIALLKGNNVLWTDGDSIELKYMKLALPDDSDGLSLNQKVRKAIEIIKGKAINEELKKEETKKSTTKGRRKKS